MSRGIGGMGLDRHQQGLASQGVITLGGVEHGEIVVGLGELRVVVGEASEYLHGFLGSAFLHQDEALEKARFRVLGVGFEELVQAR